MANSQDTPLSEEDKVRFKLLHRIYAISKGYKFVPIPFVSLYNELSARNEKEQRLVCESYEYLRNAGLMDSKWIGNVGITHEGINEFESAILKPRERTTNFPAHISEILSQESRESIKKEIETIQSQRRLFYNKAKESPKGRMQEVNASKIMEGQGYDIETIERIYFYLVDEGVIKGVALGGDFILTGKGFEEDREMGGRDRINYEAEDISVERKTDEIRHGTRTQSAGNSGELDKSEEFSRLNIVLISSGLSKYVNMLLDSQFPQHDLMNVDDFLKYLEGRGVKLSKEELEFYDRCGIVRPALRVRLLIDNGNFDTRNPFSLKNAAIRESREGIELPSDGDFQPWKNYAEKENERVVLYYHPFQLILAHWLTKNNGKSLGPLFIIEHLSEVNEERLDSWKAETSEKLVSSAKAAVDTWIPIVGLLMLLDEVYSVMVTGAFSGDRSSQEQWMLWLRRKEIASQIRMRICMSLEQVKQAYDHIVTLGHIHDPLAHWYPLLELIKREKKEKLTGDARLAQEYYELARMIKLFIEDWTGEIMLDPDDKFDSNHANWKPHTYGGYPVDYDDPKTQQLMRDDYFIDRPFLIAIVFEGDTEELVIEEILRLFMRDPKKEGYFLYNTQGSGNMNTRNLDAMIGLAKSNQMEIYLIMDNDGDVDSIIERHKKLGNIKDGMFTVWNKDFEYDNFGSGPVIEKVNQILKSKGFNLVSLKEVEDRMDTKGEVLMKALSSVFGKHNNSMKFDKIISKKELARKLIAPRIAEIQKEFYVNGNWERKLPIEQTIDKLFQKFPRRY
jgi:hypothetical protein